MARPKAVYMSYSGRQMGKNAEMFRKMVEALGPKFDITVTSHEFEETRKLLQSARNVLARDYFPAELPLLDEIDRHVARVVAADKEQK